MLRWAGGKTKKDLINNEDIWREANIKPMPHKLHTTEMRRLRWARGKTKKDHINNEDIWREANIEPMTHKLHTTEMRMLRWARGKTKKDLIKNKDIWREVSIEPMTHKLYTPLIWECGDGLEARPRRTTSRTNTSGEKPTLNQLQPSQKETTEMIWSCVVPSVH